ncbi:unnamed protein product [Scytosiphon promiscuus]
MTVLSVLLALLLLPLSVPGFFVASPLRVATTPNDGRFNRGASRLHSVEQSNAYPGDDAALVAINASRIDFTALAERKEPASAYQITRPRWYNKAEVAIIVLLCQRLQMLDLKGVEHMLDAASAFAKEDPRNVWQRALFLSKAAPGANFRTVIQRHPRTLLVPVHKMQRVFAILNEAYPDANMSRVLERIPSVLSRNATRLEINIAGLKKHAPEVDSATFQAAPSMIFLPPHTVEDKVAALRACLPGLDLFTFLKGMPTVLGRSKETVPRGISQLRERFPTASEKELVRIVKSAPSLVRMSGANGSLSIKASETKADSVDHLMALLPGVNVTNVISNAPGVLIRGVASLPVKVTKLQELFPSANVTKMVSRTPGIMYLDIDRTIRPKAMWIQEAVGLDQEGLDRLVEQGPWLLKAGWGPLARLPFAVEAGIATLDRPSSIFSLVRRSRVAFAAAHHPAYADFLRKRLEEEGMDGGSKGQEDDANDDAEGRRQEGRRQRGGGGSLHPLAWTAATSKYDRAARAAGRSSAAKRAEPPLATAARDGRRRTAKLENAGATQGVVSGSEGDQDEVNASILERTALQVAELENALGRGRKSRLGGVKDRPPNAQQSPLARVRGSPEEGDALLDLGREKIIAYETPPQRQLGA